MSALPTSASRRRQPSPFEGLHALDWAAEPDDEVTNPLGVWELALVSGGAVAAVVAGVLGIIGLSLIS